jgi:hypothetical protein
LIETAVIQPRKSFKTLAGFRSTTGFFSSIVRLSLFRKYTAGVSIFPLPGIGEHEN